MKEYYEFLGLPSSATDEEIDARYEELKAKYSEERWLDGEAGNEAARNLTKLETAYRELVALRKETQTNTKGEDAFAEIFRLLKENEVAQAQSRLDEFNERSAEWHYLQAVVYYKKNWTNESKKQLEIAIQMDPDNQKYRADYGKLNARTGQQQQQSQNPYARQTPNYNEPQQMGTGNCCNDCICCYNMMVCLSCFCNCCCQQ